MESSIYFKLLNTALAVCVLTLAPFQTSLILLFILMSTDTITGVSRAFKWGVFSSRKFKCAFKKTALYFVAIIVAILLSHLLYPILTINITFIVHYIIALLALSEFFSILENINDLGVRIPMISVFTKLKAAIPFMPKYVINWRKRLYEQTCTILDEDYRPVYNKWLDHTSSILNEIEDVKSVLKTNKQNKDFVEMVKYRVKNLLLSKYPDCSEYIDYLISLYDKYPPINRDNLYFLINKGVTYGKEKTTCP